MVTSWSTDQNKSNSIHASMSEIMILPIEDVEPSTQSAEIASYSLDYSLMTIFFAILLFLWMQ
jgi:hypothetical protein